MRGSLLLTALLGHVACRTQALRDGLALTPPMGWRSWEAFYDSVDQPKMEAVIAAMADRSRGGVSLRDVGWTDVGLDAGFEDCHARKVGDKPAFHDEHGRPLINKAKFPDIAAMVGKGHALNLTVSWYGNACACESENSYTGDMIDIVVRGTVNATVALGFDGLKLDSCSQFNNMTRWAELLAATGKPVLLENCHQGGLVPGQVMPGQDCTGDVGVSDCPYHLYRTSDDIYNDWDRVINNINSVRPYLSSDDGTPPRSRPGGWAYPDMLEIGNLPTLLPDSVEDRSMFGMWAIVSAPLVLSFDLTKRDADGGLTLDRVWPIITNKEAIAVNQRWDGSPGRLLLTDKAVLAPPTPGGYIPYPGQLGQARGWQNVPGDVGPAPWQVGKCVDEWTGGDCSHHYMDLHIENMTVDAADAWCTKSAKCEGFSYRTADCADGQACTVWFKDPTQVYFMDGSGNKLPNPPWSSHIAAGRAPPFLYSTGARSHTELTGSTTGIQIWIKEFTTPVPRVALLFVNVGQTELSYDLAAAKLPAAFTGKASAVRDVWSQTPLAELAAGADIKFSSVAPHDSRFIMLTPK